MRSALLTIALLVPLTAAMAQTEVVQGSLEILPPVTEANPRPLVSSVSASGDLVAGVAMPDDRLSTEDPLVTMVPFMMVPFMWSAENGYTLIDFPDSVAIIGAEVSIIPDGSGLVGTAVHDASGLDLSSFRIIDRAFRWTAQTDLMWLDVPPGSESRAIAASVDGSIVVGQIQLPAQFDWQPVRWMPSGELAPLSTPDGFERILPWDLSADGAVVVGTAFPIDGEGFDRTAFRWTEADGAHVLASVAERYDVSEALAVSADGQTVVGYAYNGSLENILTADAFLWRKGEPLQILGIWKPRAVSDDGSVVVGDAHIWTTDEGTLLLHETMKSHGVLLSRVADLSADGAILIGTGDGPDGQQTSWRMRLSPAERE